MFVGLIAYCMNKYLYVSVIFFLTCDNKKILLIIPYFFSFFYILRRITTFYERLSVFFDVVAQE